MSSLDEARERIAKKVAEMLQHPDVQVSYGCGTVDLPPTDDGMIYVEADGSRTLTISTPPT